MSTIPGKLLDFVMFFNTVRGNYDLVVFRGFGGYLKHLLHKNDSGAITGVILALHFSLQLHPSTLKVKIVWLSYFSSGRRMMPGSFSN